VIWFGKSRSEQESNGLHSERDERRRWKNVKNEKGRKNYRRLRKELKRATEEDEKKYAYLESICDEIIEFEKKGTLCFNVDEDKGTGMER
jgi:hypothetical protein